MSAKEFTTKGTLTMSLDMQKLSPHLQEVLLNLKHMSPMQRFNELSRPRFELNWQTMAFRYGIEKLERQGWLISDQEILQSPSSRVIARNRTSLESQKPQKQSLPLMNADDADLKQNHARVNPGDESAKSFRFGDGGVEVRGRGGPQSGPIAEIARHRASSPRSGKSEKSKTRFTAENTEVGGEKHAPQNAPHGDGHHGDCRPRLQHYRFNAALRKFDAPQNEAA
jgi:hypothetical protein